MSIWRRPYPSADQIGQGNAERRLRQNGWVRVPKHGNAKGPGRGSCAFCQSRRWSISLGLIGGKLPGSKHFPVLWKKGKLLLCWKHAIRTMRPPAWPVRKSSNQKLDEAAFKNRKETRP